MKYQVTKIDQIHAAIKLWPETEQDRDLVEVSKDEDTMLYHYQSALETAIHPEATFLSLVDSTRYPKEVLVKYQIARGI